MYDVVFGVTMSLNPRPRFWPLTALKTNRLLCAVPMIGWVNAAPLTLNGVAFSTASCHVAGAWDGCRSTRYVPLAGALGRCALGALALTELEPVANLVFVGP